MPPSTKIAERIAIMETVSERLVDATDRLGDIAEGLRTNIAVHEERLKNQDTLIAEVRQSVKDHQAADIQAHKQMNDKLDSINSKIDGLVGADSVRAARQIADDVPKPSFGAKVSDFIDSWKYWFYGGLFVAGVLTHKANLFDYIEKIFTGHN